jgi:hypothetical protein
MRLEPVLHAADAAALVPARAVLRIFRGREPQISPTPHPAKADMA